VANSKEYELLFLMKAQMDSSMKQFSVVGGQIKELEEKVQQYENTLKDIEGYRNQVSAIGELEEKMRSLEAGTADVNQRFNEATAATQAARAEVEQHKAAINELNMVKAENGKLTKEQRVRLEEEKQALQKSREQLKQAEQAEKEATTAKNAHQKSIDDLREKLAAERQKLQEVIEALKQAGVDTSNLEAEERKLNETLEETRDKQEEWVQFRDNIEALANQFTVLRMAANGAQKVIQPILNFYKESLSAAADLEYSMSAVEAISGATADETEKMTAVVKEMGATTIFTAEEAAGAMEKMALAGWETEQMIAGLPAVIKLAAAAGEDLADMTSIVSDGMNAFHLTGEKAAVEFADVLAKAATSSNTTVALLGQSLSYAETTAGNLGYSIQDVSLALAAMANNALKGGSAGTALNTILTRMSGANENAAAVMDELGLSMYDTNGVAKDLLTFLNELRGAFQSFNGDAQAAQVAAYRLAGMRGMRGLLAIVNQTDEQWEKLTEDIYDYEGAADTISNIRMDNYTGQVQLLKDAWDALETSVGETFLDTATDTVRALKDITTAANGLVQKNPELVRGLGTTVAVAAGAATTVTTLATAFQGLRYAMNMLKVGELLKIVGGFAGVAGASVGLGALVAMFSSDSRTEEEKALATKIENYRELNNTIEETIENYKEQGDLENERTSRGSYIESLIQQQDEYRAAMEDADKALEEYMTGLGRSRNADGTWDTAGMTEGEAMGYVDRNNQYRKAKQSMEETTQAIREQREAYIANTRAVVEDQRQFAAQSQLTTEHYETMTEAVEALATAYQECYSEYKEMYDGIFGTFEEVGEITETTTAQMLKNLKGQNDYWTKYADNLERIRSYAEGNGIDLSSVWGDLSDGSADAMSYTNAIVNDLSSLPEIVDQLRRNTPKWWRRRTPSGKPTWPWTPPCKGIWTPWRTRR
jgi:TP901 family phage tail tape measure protein